MGIYSYGNNGHSDYHIGIKFWHRRSAHNQDLKALATFRKNLKTDYQLSFSGGINTPTKQQQ